MTVEPRRRRRRVMRYLFERSVNRVDGMNAAIGAVAVSQGHWIIGLVGFAVGACISLAGVAWLKRAELLW